MGFETSQPVLFSVLLKYFGGPFGRWKLANFDREVIPMFLRCLLLSALFLYCSKSCIAGGMALSAAFGDSLVDRQNFYLASGATFPDPSLYSDGRFSNGPLWIERLAERLGHAPLPASLAGGTNFGFNAARITGTSPAPYDTVPNVEQQVASYLSATGNVASPNGLYAMWAGANDFFFGETDPSVPVASLAQSISDLYAAGAREFLVLNLPALGQTPFFKATAYEGPLDAASAGFNAYLAATIAGLNSSLPGVSIYELDVYTLFQQIQSDPTAFGLTNATDSATNYDPISGIGTSLAVANPNEYLFWDSVHPTESGHRIIGDAAFAALVPEPSAMVLICVAAVVAAVASTKSGLARKANRIRGPGVEWANVDHV